MKRLGHFFWVLFIQTDKAPTCSTLPPHPKGRWGNVLEMKGWLASLMSVGVCAWKQVHCVVGGDIRNSIRGDVEGRRKQQLGTIPTKDEGLPLMVGQGGANLKEKIQLMGRFG